MAHSHSNSDAHHGHAAGEKHGVGHVVSPKILISTAIGLLILTFVTVESAKINFAQLDLPELNIFVAMAIAAMKASLVCLFFMHLKWDRSFNAFMLVTSIGLVALFMAFAMTDTFEYRPDINPGESELIKTKLNELPPAGSPPAHAPSH